MTDDLAAMTAFAEARLSEDEAAAKAATPGRWLALDGGVQSADDETQWPVSQTESARDRADRVHIARQDPARTLRRVEAQRKILAEHKAVIRLAGLTGQELGFHGWYREWVLRNLIADWSDHPDYLPGWAPSAAGHA